LQSVDCAAHVKVQLELAPSQLRQHGEPLHVTLSHFAPALQRTSSGSLPPAGSDSVQPAQSTSQSRLAATQAAAWQLAPLQVYLHVLIGGDEHQQVWPSVQQATLLPPHWAFTQRGTTPTCPFAWPQPPVPELAVPVPVPVLFDDDAVPPDPPSPRAP
jgi:hypothetical protein